VLVFDAIDFDLPPGTIRVLRDNEVPVWGCTRLSPHQNGFNDVLALAQLNRCAPECIVAIGVQPIELGDFGGSLSPVVRARLPEVVRLGARELEAWGFPGTPRAKGVAGEPLHSGALALDPYESGRPSAADACRIGDPRVLRVVSTTQEG
jgi:hydrogenase maturation protease